MSIRKIVGCGFGADFEDWVPDAGQPGVWRRHRAATERLIGSERPAILRVRFKIIHDRHCVAPTSANRLTRREEKTTVHSGIKGQGLMRVIEAKAVAHGLMLGKLSVEDGGRMAVRRYEID